MTWEQIRWWRTSFGKEEANEICNSIEHENNTPKFYLEHIGRMF